jgi:glycerol-3-phosphate acyltransferase PlsY
MDKETALIFLLFPALAYLLGSIPFGLLIGKARGIDVRSTGSGNIGATNVGRLLGRKWGYICFLLDVAKGLLSVLLANLYLSRSASPAVDGTLSITAQWALLAVAAGCIIGHMFSLYLGFRGGKGVATSLGVVLGVWPYFTLTALIALCVWIAVWGWWRYVSLASICGALAFPIGFTLLIWRIDTWQFHSLLPLFSFSCLMAVLVIFRHRANIKRLLAGTENRPSKS